MATKKNPTKVVAKKAAPKKSPNSVALGKKILKAAEVEGLVKRLPPPVQPIVNTLRKIVAKAAPEAVEFLEKSKPAYKANGVFARIEPHESKVLLHFLKGAQLPSGKALSKGKSGSAASIEVRDAKAIQATVLQKLVREAVALNLSKTVGKKAKPAPQSKSKKPAAKKK